MADIDIPFGSGDTAPTIRRTLRDGAGNPVNLTGATVTFLYSKVVTTDEVAAQVIVPCTPFNASAGIYDFVWPGEAVPRGKKYDYTGQYKAVFPGGAQMHFPNSIPLLNVQVAGEP